MYDRVDVEPYHYTLATVLVLFIWHFHPTDCFAYRIANKDLNLCVCIRYCLARLHTIIKYRTCRVLILLLIIYCASLCEHKAILQELSNTFLFLYDISTHKTAITNIWRMFSVIYFNGLPLINIHR